MLDDDIAPTSAPDYVLGPPLVHDAWECGDCGWTVRQAHLPLGMTLRDVLDDHGDKYCARPPAWLAG